MTFLINLSDVNAGWGVCSYNGYTFPGLRDATLSGVPVYDESGRVSTHTRYTFRIHFFQTDADNSTHSTSMLSMLTKLTEPGGVLTITGMGFGDLVINGPSATFNDVEWGPKPQPLEMIPIGITTECIWQCDFSIKNCASSPGPIMAFNYSIDVERDDAMLTTRTISGYIQIAQSRVNGAKGAGAVGFTADSYWQQIQLAQQVPVGMKRRSSKRTLSKDRNRLDYVLVDVQLDAEAPPPNALTADIDFEIESIPPGFAKYMATLSGTIETPAGVPTIRAAEAFTSIMVQKIKTLNSTVGSGGIVLPTRVRFGHTQTTRRSSFGVSFMVTACIDDLLKNGGVWEPGPGTYAQWAATMPWYGPSLAYSPSYDALIDLCTTGAIPAIAASPPGSPQPGNSSFVFAKPGTALVAYENSLRPYREHNATTHRVAQPYVPAALGATSSSGGVSMAQTVSNSYSDVTQYQGPPKDYVLMIGKAMQVGAPPAVPRLLAVGQETVQEVKVRYDGPVKKYCFFGATFFAIRWAVLYRPTKGYLTSIPPQSNPTLCCDKVA